MENVAFEINGEIENFARQIANIVSSYTDHLSSNTLYQKMLEFRKSKAKKNHYSTINRQSMINSGKLMGVNIKLGSTKYVYTFRNIGIIQFLRSLKIEESLIRKIMHDNFSKLAQFDKLIIGVTQKGISGYTKTLANRINSVANNVRNTINSTINNIQSKSSGLSTCMVSASSKLIVQILDRRHMLKKLNNSSNIVNMITYKNNTFMAVCY